MGDKEGVLPLFFQVGGGERLSPILKARGSCPAEAADGTVCPPLPLAQILSLTYSNAFHTQCIALKVDMAVGLEYEAPKPVQTFLETVSSGDPFLELLQKAAFDWECMGNAYFEAARSRNGKIGELYHVHAQTVFVNVRGSRLAGYVQEAGGAPVEFSVFGERSGRNELFQFKRFTPLSTWYGLPDWVAALEALRLDQEKKAFYAAFFKNFAVPSYAVIMTGAEFSEEVENTVTRGLQQLKGVENAHKTMLLSVPFPKDEAEIRFEKLMVDLKDLPFEKLSQATREEILAAHGVPPRLVGIVTAGALGGGGEMEGQLLSFVEMKVKPRMRYLENRIKLILRDQGLPEEFTLKGITPSIPREEAEAKKLGERAAAGDGALREVLKSLEERGGF
ncbi:MAG: phage portal protein [Synergistaceae bacterium]|jgi:PBSX family phage portal protein|nr:phage portal protein [Synergistaceae bacterium]